MTATSRGFRRKNGSLEEVFAFLEDFTEVEEVGDREAFCINLVAEELFTNMVKHNEGGGESIAVTIERVEDHVHLELVDFDVSPFDPSSAPKVSVSAGLAEREPGGLGLHIVKTMVDELTYDYDDENRSMRISVTKRLER